MDTNDTLYCYENGEKTTIPVQSESFSSGMTLYNLNKSVISAFSNFSNEDFQAAAEIISKYEKNQKAEYYMLLCNDLRYYTIFNVVEKEGLTTFTDEVIDCLKSFADFVKAVDITESGDAIEIWFQKENEIYVMYLFNYEAGVIKCDR